MSGDTSPAVTGTDQDAGPSRRAAGARKCLAAAGALAMDTEAPGAGVATACRSRCFKSAHRGLHSASFRLSRLGGAMDKEIGRAHV